MDALTAIPKYDNYRDSGYKWIGAVPSDWEVTKLGTCLKPISVKNSPHLTLLSITREKGVIERDMDDQESNHNFIPDDLSGYKVLMRGQFGMNKMKAWQGSYGVSKFTGIVSPAYFIFDFIKLIEPSFFNWAIRSKLYVSYFGSASDGVRIGQWDLSKSRMKLIPFILPPLSEQSKIAKFLDEKTTEINEAIAIKEKQIALLKEHKQIIIQKAVTQGLNPNTPMKDSGVDWIGEIPKHWGLKKLKYSLHLTNEKTKSKDSSLRYLGMESVESNTGKLSGIKNDAEGLATRFKKDQILFGKLRPYLAKVYLAEFDGICSTEFLVYDVTKMVNHDYAAKLLLSNGFINTVNASTYGSKMPRASADFIGSMWLAIPPVKEQQKISDYIDKVSSQITKLTSSQVKQIEKLKEYKTTLINSAVTGKIKVI